MATKIRGITVEIGGDTSGLDKALSSTNKNIRDTQSQLKDVERLLKLDPHNVELLRQKQQLLTKSVDETKKKLDALKKAQATMDANGVDKNSEEYMALQREIVATSNSLDELTKSQKEATKNSSKLSAGLSKVGSVASSVAEKTKKLSTVATGLLASLTALAIKSATSADDLNTLAKQTGIATDELQKMQYASDLVDVSVDTITSSIRKMKRNMDSTSTDVIEAWQTIGVAVRDTEENLRDSTTVFYEALEGLSKIENETERDTLAMSIFGKSADELAGIIDDGGQSLRELGDEAESLGLILSQETLDSLNEVNDEIDTLKAQAKATLALNASKLLEALTPVLTDVCEALSNLCEWLSTLDSTALKVILGITTGIALISPIASMVAGITTVLKLLIPVISAVNATLLANPILLIITAVVALLALCWKFRKEIWQILQDIGGFFKNMWDKIVSGCKSALNLVISLINKAIGGINSLINKINAVSVQLPEWLGGGQIGVNIPNIPNIPMLANGGVLTQGSAIVGEAGAELLTVNQGKATVQPLTATIDSKALAGLNTNTNVNIEFSGSLAQLAKVLNPAIKAEQIRVGNSFVG